MNIEYLQNEIIPIRNKEIELNENLGTRQPIYVVLDLDENYISVHSDYTPTTNYKNIRMEFGYIDEDLDSELREFHKTNSFMKNPIPVTRFYTDRIVAFFLTSKGAHDYLKYQKHNLDNPYVYVFYSGYGNIEMDNLLNNK